jgi:hypothetical protein
MRDVMAGKTADDVKTGFRGRAIVEGRAGTAARTVDLLGGIFSYAVLEGLRTDNPVQGVKRPADRRRDGRLSPEGYKALGEALAEAEAEGENWAAIAAVRLLALLRLPGVGRSRPLCCRRSPVNISTSSTVQS